MKKPSKMTLWHVRKGTFHKCYCRIMLKAYCGTFNLAHYYFPVKKGGAR